MGKFILVIAVYFIIQCAWARWAGASLGSYHAKRGTLDVPGWQKTFWAMAGIPFSLSVAVYVWGLLP